MSEQVQYSPDDQEQLLPEVTFYDLIAPEGVISDTALTLLTGRMGEKKALLWIVHPYFYDDERRHWNNPTTARGEILAGYAQRYERDFIPELSTILSHAKQNSIPVVIAQETSLAPFTATTSFDLHRDKYSYKKEVEEATQRLKRNLAQFHPDLPEDIFITLTHPTHPTPRVDIYKHSGSINSVTEQFAQTLVQKTGVETIYFAGSYLGGSPQGNAFADWYGSDKGFLTSAHYHPILGRTELEGLASNTTSNSFDLNVRASYQDVLDTGAIIDVKGCLPYLMNYFAKTGVNVHVTPATFPEKFPLASNLSAVEIAGKPFFTSF